ncbi:ABC transporter permease [Thiobaca trueperi]|uniref:ABC-2 type transport system permease protein n=1 Tax=Thiobaca trueperi TaxID=127458 RepID=A0A4R3N361_9GAMM|nr:ABC transporter permease subunit [Thiobaca trueperi]TCT22747.1 ABC-2 type transport system permease protein [Thiobaca trueperi]
MIGVLAGREIRSGLVTPLPWILLGAGQIVLAWIFLQVIETFSGLGADERVASLTQELALNLFGFAAVIAMLAAPLLAMRMLSGEFRDGSFDLIGAAPLRIVEMVLGKFLGLIALITPLCLLPALNLLLLADVAGLDAGQIAAATLGLWLAAILFCAIGLYASSLTAQPGAAVLIAFGILLLFSIIGRAESFAVQTLSLFGWLSWNEHLFWFLLGAVRLSDLAYFILFTGLFLALTHRRLANRRLQ